MEAGGYVCALNNLFFFRTDCSIPWKKINKQITKRAKSMLEYKQFLNNNHHQCMHTYTNKESRSQKFLKIGNIGSPHTGHRQRKKACKEVLMIRTTKNHDCQYKYILIIFLFYGTLNISFHLFCRNEWHQAQQLAGIHVSCF